MVNACLFLKKVKKGWSSFSVKVPAKIDNSGAVDPYAFAREGCQGLLVPASRTSQPRHLVAAWLATTGQDVKSSLHGPHFNPPDDHRLRPVITNILARQLFLCRPQNPYRRPRLHFLAEVAATYRAHWHTIVNRRCPSENPTTTRQQSPSFL
jgi:hypothetical protein